MKRLTIYILVLTLVISVTGTALALEPTDRIIYQAEEIKNIEHLWERANEGVSDTDNFVIMNASLKNVTGTFESNTQDDLVVEQLSTTQKLREVEKADGTIVTSYATTAFSSLIDKNKIGLEASRSWDENDGSISVRHVATIHFTTYRDQDTHLYVKPEQITATWYKLDNQVEVLSSRYGAEWDGNNGNSFVKGSDYLDAMPVIWGNPRTNIIKSVGGSGYIDVTPFGKFVAFEQRDRLKRSNSSATWEFLTNQVFAENLNK